MPVTQTSVKSAYQEQKVQPETVALFVSDLHLQTGMPLTTQAFYRFLTQHGRYARQLYLLGDIFEYWAGDDDLATPYHQEIVTAIRQISNSGVAVYWIAGNRDFLVGEQFAQAAGLTLLPDPYVLTLAGQRITLAHGDAQCTDDLAYMAFRAQVRQPAWQSHFLSMPLAQRKAIIEDARKSSQRANQEKHYDIMDVNEDAIKKLLSDTHSRILIHGHTHRPALHTYHYAPSSKEMSTKTDTSLRYVLPDWEYDTSPVRGGWISLTKDGVLHRFDADGKLLPPVPGDNSISEAESI